MNYKEMLNAARGANLWFPWDEDSEECLYWTFGHIDPENELIKSALAKALQRAGVVSSLGAGFRAVNSSNTVGHHRYIGHVNGEEDPVLCDKDGDTAYDGHIDEDTPDAITLIEVDIDGE